LGREVRQGEALAGAGTALIDKLADATDAPVNETGVKRGSLPQFFKTWGPVAWVDLLDGLPDEQTSDEISDPAREEFRSKVRAGLFALVALAYNRDTDARDVQRRTLADWARMFAKPGRWQSVRSYKLWSRLDDGRLRIALRVDLFGQVPGGSGLAHLHPRAFSDLAKLYDVGTEDGTKVSGGNIRAIELTTDFITELYSEPVDGQTDAETRAHAREETASV
jgi:hypothetical protein